MLVIRSQFRVLLAQKAQSEGRTISLREVTREAGVPISTVLGLANNTIREVPLEPLAALCRYLRCDVGEILRLEEQ